MHVPETDPQTRSVRTVLGAVTAVVAAAALAGAASETAVAAAGATHDRAGTLAARGAAPVHVTVHSPSPGSEVGAEGRGWVVDLELDVRGERPLESVAFSALQLTGPGPHADVPPLPGSFAPGADDRLPGLVVLTSTTTGSLPGFAGPGTNLADLFNLTGVGDRSRRSAEIRDTWIVGAPIAGSEVPTVLTVAVVDDLDGDGVLDDAPDVVADLTGDGRVDQHDLRRLGVASNVVTVNFRIDGASL